MNFDFPTFLVAAVFLSGLIWLVDALFFASKRKLRLGGSPSQSAKAPVLVEYARSFFPVFLIVLLIRSFLIEPFRIPSGSMLPTLWVGDFIVVNKFSYGLRLPVLNTKFWEVESPKRGDVVVFKHPTEKVDYIKRIVGVPGDTITYANKHLIINGEPLHYESLSDRFVERGEVYNLYEETLGEKKHKIMLSEWNEQAKQSWIVPLNHYFVMGDNRDNSNDGRVFGMVSDDNLVGKAFAVWLSWDSQSEGFFNFNGDRMFKMIDGEQN